MKPLHALSFSQLTSCCIYDADGEDGGLEDIFTAGSDEIDTV